MPSPPASLRHRHPARPLRFPAEEPESETLGETTRHLVLRTALWQILKLAFGAPTHRTVGSEQFIYFNARDPRRCCAPDVYVKLDVHVPDVTTWKVWEHGAPELAVEILSPSDAERWTWDDKLERYHELGVRELVRFDPDAPAGHRLAVWDRIDDDLVEREIDADTTRCLTLELWWLVAPVADYPAALRLARDAEGRGILPTPEERVAHLEAQLARRPR